MTWPPTVLVLASGRGERFRAAGGQGSKLQALLDGKPVLAHTLAAVKASGLPWHLEDAGHPGMGDSIAAAVRATRDAHGWLILPGDLPLIRPATLQAVADAIRGGAVAAQPAHQPTGVRNAAVVRGGEAVVQRVHGGQRGHPVGFGRGSGAELANLQGNRGAAHVLAGLRAINLLATVAVDDIGVLMDIDTPAALAKAEAIIRSGPRPHGASDRAT